MTTGLPVLPRSAQRRLAFSLPPAQDVFVKETSQPHAAERRPTAVLDVADHATLQEIEAAYYRKVYAADPVERDMLNQAYELLNDDDRRRWYDSERDAAGR